MEDQATDRTHRIGRKTKVVTSYKLISARHRRARKILILQNSGNQQRNFINATIGGEEISAASLNWEEIQELLA